MQSKVRFLWRDASSHERFLAATFFDAADVYRRASHFAATVLARNDAA